MLKLRKLPTGVWIALAIVLGMVFAPIAAIGAASVVHIAGSNGVKASVTNANQLTTAEAAPSTFKEYYTGSSGCNLLVKVPSKKAFIIKTVVFNNTSLSTPAGSGTYVGLFLNDNTCTGNYFLDFNPAAAVDHIQVPLEPGVAVKSGSSVYAGQNGTSSDVFVIGYLVPSKDVPANTAVVAPTRARSANHQK